MSASGSYLIVEWKNKSVSMLPKEDVLGDSNIAVDAKVTARYNNRVLDAKILHIGDFDQIHPLFEAMQPCSLKAASGGTSSPKGRGHRVMTRKTMSDFVSLDLPSEDEIPVRKKKTLQRHAAAAAGEDVIQQLLRQSDKEGEGKDDDNSITFNLDNVVLQSEDTTQVEELKAQLEKALNRIKELEEQNAALQKKLPNMVVSLQKCVDRLMASVSNSTPRLPTISPVTKQTSRHAAVTPTRPATSTSLPTVPTTPQMPASPLESHELSAEPLEDFQLSQSLIHRAMQAKDKSKLVCNLLRCLFTRREMATSSLAGKDYAKGKKVLDPKKVEAIINIVQKKYSDCERTFVRTRITQKLKDERRAFFTGNETES